MNTGSPQSRKGQKWCTIQFCMKAFLATTAIRSLSRSHASRRNPKFLVWSVWGSATSTRTKDDKPLDPEILHTHNHFYWYIQISLDVYLIPEFTVEQKIYTQSRVKN